jgi:hypothetical protein
MRFAVNDPPGKRIVLEKHESFLGAFAIRDFSCLLCRVMHECSSTIAQGLASMLEDGLDSPDGSCNDARAGAVGDSPIPGGMDA